MAGQISGQPQEQGQSQAGQSQAVQASSLVGLLEGSNLSLSEEQIGAVEKALVASGWRTKQQIDRMTQTAYLSGQQSAEAALKKQAAPKREDPPLTEDSGGQPWVQPQGQPGMDPRMLATLNEVVKRQKATEAQLGEIQAENTRLKDERREREVGSRVLKAISEEGLDAPDSVLLLIRNQCAVDFVPDPSDANELQVVRSGGDPHVRMPVDGPGTYTTVPEFVKRWANSPEGLRYKRVPEGAKQGAGVSGGGGGNTQIGKGPLHIDNKRAAMKELGFI